MKITITTFKTEEVDLEFPFYLKSGGFYVKALSEKKFIVILEKTSISEQENLYKTSWELATHEEFKQALDSTILKLSQE